jgi:hypothetical protein
MSRYSNPVYDQFAVKLNLQLKPQEADIKISPNLIYSAISPQYTSYEVSIDSKEVSMWFTESSVFTAELNLKLKPQANNIRISLNLTYDSISPPIDRI